MRLLCLVGVQMASVKDVPAAPFIAALAAHFKSTGKIELPQWADLVKTGCGRELAPTDPDWFYVRAGTCEIKPWLVACWFILSCVISHQSSTRFLRV